MTRLQIVVESIAAAAAEEEGGECEACNAVAAKNLGGLVRILDAKAALAGAGGCPSCEEAAGRLVAASSLLYSGDAAAAASEAEAAVTTIGQMARSHDGSSSWSVAPTPTRRPRDPETTRPCASPRLSSRRTSAAAEAVAACSRTRPSLAEVARTPPSSDR